MGGVVVNPPVEYGLGEGFHAWLRAGTLPAVLDLAGTRESVAISFG